MFQKPLTAPKKMEQRKGITNKKRKSGVTVSKKKNSLKDKNFACITIIRFCKLIHILLNIGIFAVCLDFYNSRYNDYGVGDIRFMIFVGLYTLVLLFSLRTYKAYDFGMTDNGILIYSQALAGLVTNIAFYVVFVVANSKVFNPLPLAGFFLIQIIADCIWTCIVNQIYFRLNAPKKSVVFYRAQENVSHLEEVYKREKNFEITEVVECTADWVEHIKNCEVVFLVDLSKRDRNQIFEYCIKNNIQCYASPHIGDIIMMGATHLDMFSVPVFEISRVTLNIEYLIIKRIVDIVFSLFGIVVLSPVMVVTAIAIRMYDKGPALYKQVRLTKDGKEFKILKFRSMRVNAESDGVARLATSHDDRITPIGKIIRACRIDELPQLFNILKGDMSIVGPRPERPEIAKQYLEELPAFDLRLQVQAGLTGLAQVYGKYNTEPLDKLQMDLMYINNMSILQDFKLIMATIKVLFMKESTHGTAEGQTTALVKKNEKDFENK